MDYCFEYLMPDQFSNGILLAYVLKKHTIFIEIYRYYYYYYHNDKSLHQMRAGMG